MRRLWLIATASALYAQPLSSLIDSAHTNEKIISLNQRVNAAGLNHDAIEHSYLPRIDAFTNGTFVDHTGGFDAKRSVAAGLKGEVTLFDGFKREHALQQSDALENSARYNLSSGKKEITLDVIRQYFELQNTLDEIQTQTRMYDHLSAQLTRLEKFRSVGLASEDALMRIRSELSHAQYQLEDLRYQSDRQKGDLETISNQKITDLQPSTLMEPKLTQAQQLDSLKALQYSRDAKRYEAEKADAGFLPTIKIEDQLAYFDYYQDPMASYRVNTQNKVIASLSMNLLDFSTASTTKQALMAQAQAQSSELAYASKEANQNFVMAMRYIERSRALIDAAQSAFDAATQTFDAVTHKYEARIVDYVTYLDALHSLTDATNRLSRAKRSLHYAYATYYYYAGQDPKEFIQ